MPHSLPGQSAALVIGINGYGNGIPPLRSAVSDARRLAKLLELLGYDVALLDKAVTLAAIRSAVTESLPAKAHGPEDRLLVYFAGHGMALDGPSGPEGYLLPEDAVWGKPFTFLPMAELQQALDQLPCRHLLVILDCCFAGGFRWASYRSSSARPSVLYRQRFERYLRGRAWQAIASASHRQQALDLFGNRGSGEHSPFAAALFAGLEGKADLYPPGTDGKPSGDGVITVTELFAYLREQVADRAESQFHSQTPVFWPLKRHEDGEFIFLAPGRAPALPEAPPLTKENNPYRGLEPYDTAHKDLFVGRAEVSRKLVEKVETKLAVASAAASADKLDKASTAEKNEGVTLTIVTGPSGAGKSSLVRAGLMPELEARGWTVFPSLRPGKAPLTELANWAAKASFATGTNLNLELKGDPAVFARWRTGWTTAHPDARLLIVVDQLEELVTMCSDADESNAFLTAMAALVADADEQIRVVFTIRSDFEGQFRGGPLKANWEKARFPIPPLDQDDYRQIITDPASARAVFFETPQLVEDLVNEVVHMPGGLPLLSFTLSEMYLHYVERSGDDRCLTRADYVAVGRVVESLRNRVERLYQEELTTDAERETLKRVMLRMVSHEGGTLARRRVPLDELTYASKEENQRVQAVLGKLTAVRLVVPDQDAEGRPVAEPAHDALVNGWDRLLRWTREEQEQLALRRLLTPAANDWKAGRGGLWHANARLRQCETQLGVPAWHSSSAPQPESDSWLNKDEADFLSKSLRKRRLVSQVRLAVAGLVIILLAGAGVLFHKWSNEQQVAESRRREKLLQEVLTAESTGLQAQLEVGPSLWDNSEPTDPSDLNPRAKYAAHHYAKACTLARDLGYLELADRNLHRLALLMRKPQIMFGHSAHIVHMAISRSGELIATSSLDRTTRIWNASTGECLHVFDHSKIRPNIGHVVCSEFDVTEKYLVTGVTSNIQETQDGSLEEAPHRNGDTYAFAWKLSKGAQPTPIVGHSSGVRRVLADPSGDRVLTVTFNGELFCHSIQSAQLAFGPVSPVGDAAFCANGKHVITYAALRVTTFEASLIPGILGSMSSDVTYHTQFLDAKDGSRQRPDLSPVPPAKESLVGGKITETTVLHSQLTVLPSGDYAASTVKRGRSASPFSYDQSPANARTVILDGATLTRQAVLDGAFQGINPTTGHVSTVHNELLVSWVKQPTGYKPFFVAAQGRTLDNRASGHVAFSSEVDLVANRAVANGVHGVSFPLDGPPRLWKLASGDLLSLLPDPLGGDATCCLVEGNSRFIACARWRRDSTNDTATGAWKHALLASEGLVECYNHVTTTTDADAKKLEHIANRIGEEAVRGELQSHLKGLRVRLEVAQSGLTLSTKMHHIRKDLSKLSDSVDVEKRKRSFPLVIWHLASEGPVSNPVAWVEEKTKSRLDLSNSFGISEILTEEQRQRRAIAPYSERPK